MIFFEAKVKFTNELEGGANERTGNYIMQALSYADAEARIIEEMTPFNRGGEIEVDIKKVRYAEIVEDKNLQEYNWYKSKVDMIVFDGEKEKKSSITYLVQAATIEGARKTMEKNITTDAGDTEIVLLQKTAIIDYFNFAIADVKPVESI